MEALEAFKLQLVYKFIFKYKKIQNLNKNKY